MHICSHKFSLLLWNSCTVEGKKRLEGEQATVQPQACGSLSSHMSFIYYAHGLGRLKRPDFHLKSVMGPVFWFFVEKLHPVHLKMVWIRVGWIFVVCLLFELVDKREENLGFVDFFFFWRCLKLRFVGCWKRGLIFIVDSLLHLNMCITTHFLTWGLWETVYIFRNRSSFHFIAFYFFVLENCCISAAWFCLTVEALSSSCCLCIKQVVTLGSKP